MSDDNVISLDPRDDEARRQLADTTKYLLDERKLRSFLIIYNTENGIGASRYLRCPDDAFVVLGSMQVAIHDLVKLLEDEASFPPDFEPDNDSG